MAKILINDTILCGTNVDTWIGNLKFTSTLDKSGQIVVSVSINEINIDTSDFIINVNNQTESIKGSANGINAAGSLSYKVTDDNLYFYITFDGNVVQPNAWNSGSKNMIVSFGMVNG